MAEKSVAELAADALARVRSRVQRYDFEQEPTLIHNRVEVPMHDAQKVLYSLEEQEVAAIAGKQSGKTACGPYWSLREIQRKGGGAFLVIGPTFPVMNKQLIPSCQAVWERRWGMGEYKQGDKKFVFNERGLAMLGVPDAIVWFCFAENPNSLVSVTACGAWLDEPGHPDFSREANEEIDARLSVNRGRKLYTSSPYAFNYFKFDVFDKAAKRYFIEQGEVKCEERPNGDSNVAVVSYRSKDNPSFDDERWWELKEKMPAWKFSMHYEGKFTKPAGVVFDCFDESNLCKRFDIPPHWKRVAGHDFGPLHTAGWWMAQNPENSKWYVYAVYQDGGKSTEEHSEAFRNKAEGKLLGAWGGTWSEDTWRADYSLRDYPISRPPIRDLMEGIDRMYAMLKANDLVIFDDLPVVQDFYEYAYEIDDLGEPIQGKITAKEKFHILDSGRYVVSAVYGMFVAPATIYHRMKTRHAE